HIALTSLAGLVPGCLVALENRRAVGAVAPGVGSGPSSQRPAVPRERTYRVDAGPRAKSDRENRQENRADRGPSQGEKHRGGRAPLSPPAASPRLTPRSARSGASSGRSSSPSRSS